VKYFDWDEEKNQKLLVEREVCFEDVLIALDEGRLYDILYHPNPNRYKDQLILVVEITQYIYLVPFVEDEEKIFLKTIIPSRKATKKYLIDKK
jgi:uncharacterized DUF497 family protein